MSNVFSFVGTVGSDAQVRYTAAGLAVLSVNVANNIGFGDKQQTLWLRVAVFGKRAEGRLVEYLKKGQAVFVSGELTQSQYQGQDGTLRTALGVTAQVVELVGGRKEGSAAAPVPSADYDDDIPF